MQQKPWERDWKQQSGSRPSTIIDDPYRAAEEQRKRDAAARAQQDQQFEAQRIAAERERVELDRQRAQITREAEERQAATQRAEMEKAARERSSEADRMNALVKQINEVQSLFNSGPGATQGASGIRDFFPSAANSRFDSAAASLEDLATAAFKVPGMGAQSDADAARLAAAIKPDRWAYDEATDQKLKDVRRRVGEWYASRGLLPPTWEAPKGRFAESQAQGVPLTPGNISDEIARQTSGVPNVETELLFREAERSDRLGKRTPEFIAEYRRIFGRDPGDSDPADVFGPVDDSPPPPPGGGLDPQRDTLGGSADAIVRGVSDTATLGLSNPLNAAVNSLLNGTSFADEWANEKAVIAADERVNPYLRLGGQFAGGIASGYGLARGGAAALPSRPLLGVAAAETGGGALYGGVTSEDPVAGALIGGISGLAGNQIGQRVLGPLVDRVMSRGTAPALRQLSQALPEDDMQVASALLGEARGLGVPMAIADTGTKARMLAGSATRLAPGGREFAEEVILPRGLAQGERALDAIARDLAQPVNMIDQRAAIQQAARTESQPLYEAAFSRAAPVDDDITAMLGTPAGREALNRAVTIARNEGRDPNALGFDLDELGQVVTVSNPSFETLHMVKRGLDSVVEGNRGPTGVLNRSDPAVAAIDSLRARFRSRLGELDPNYAAANQAYAGQMRNRDALDFGYDAISPRANPDMVADALTRMPREAMQTGYASGLANQVEGVRGVSDPFKAIYGTPRQQQKIATVFPEGAERFGRQAELEGMLARTQYETLGGSPTAGRMAADAQLGPGLGMQMAQDVGVGMVTGIPPIGTIQQAARAGLADKLRFGLGGQQRAEDIARLLLDPETSLETLQEAILRRAARDRIMQGSAAFGGAVALPLAGNQ